MLDAAQVSPVLVIEFVGRIEHTIIVIDSFLLDISIRTFPLDWWVLEILSCDGKSAKCSFDRWESALYALQVRLIDNEPFEIDPFVFIPYLDPTMDDVGGCEIERQAENGAFL